MSTGLVARVNADVILAIGVALVAPLMISWLYGDGSWRSFLLPGVALITLGGAGVLVTRPHRVGPWGTSPTAMFTSR